MSLSARTFFLALLLVLLGCAGLCAGEYSGVAEWRYARYRAEEGSEKIEKGRHFTQQYSLFYEKEGLFGGGRGGSYTLGLGAEWTDVDATINEEDFDFDTFKILYRGEVLLSPGGLPIRMHAYSRDMTRTYLLPSGGFALRDMIEPRIITDISNGQRIESGLNLALGVKNGTYDSPYRDIWVDMPRLLIDFKEVRVRDLESSTPEDYRDRHVAFISLNKKDNWFHFRYLEHEDFLESENDFEETSYTLGTIDHFNRRRWINLTNWVKISADGSYTETNRLKRELTPEDRYDINFFANFHRPSWRAVNLTNYHRTRTTDSLEHDVEVPVFASGVIDPQTSWKLRFIAAREDEELRSVHDFEDNLYLSAQVEALKGSPFVLSPFVATEYLDTRTASGEAFEARLEIFSNPRFHRGYDLFSAYEFRYLDGHVEDDFTVDYQEHKIELRAERSQSVRLRYGAGQSLLYGSGSLDHSTTRYIVPEGDMNFVASIDSLNRLEGSTFRATSTLFAEYTGIRRLNNRLELVYDYIDNGVKADSQVIAEHRLSYDRLKFLFDMSNRLVWGGSPSDSGMGGNFVNGALVRNVDWTFSHHSSLHYSPAAFWEGNLMADYSHREGDDVTSRQWRIEQELKYHFFSPGVLSRKYFTAIQEFEFEQADFTDSPTRRAMVFSLGGEWYPLRHFYLGGQVRYRLFDPEDREQFIYDMRAGLNYPKIQVAFDYSYGTEPEKNGSPERMEHRWEVLVRKIF